MNERTLKVQFQSSELAAMEVFCNVESRFAIGLLGCYQSPPVNPCKRMPSVARNSQWLCDFSKRSLILSSIELKCNSNVNMPITKHNLQKKTSRESRCSMLFLHPTIIERRSAVGQIVFYFIIFLLVSLS